MLHLPLYILILVPIVCSIILPLFAKHQNIRETISIFSGILNLVFALYFLSNIEQIKTFKITYTLITINEGVNIGFILDNFGALFAVMVNFLWVVTIIYSIGYMRKHEEKNQTRFFSFFSLAIACTLGIALSKNLWTIFLFYELLTLSTFPLVAHNFNKKIKKSVYTYLQVLIVSSLVLFLGAIILTFLYAETTEFTENGVFKNNNLPPIFIIFILLLFIFGVAKAAVMPLHKWLPSAMVAPTPVSALLHAVAVVKSGLFILIKVVLFIFGTEFLHNMLFQISSFNWLVIIPSITIIVASTIALFQNNLKKMLAYSTISQLSYTVLGLLILYPVASIGAMMQVLAHAFAKITLFFAAGSILVIAHKENISQLTGIGKKLPITMICFTIAALSMVGFPLTLGFLSKWFLIQGALLSGSYIALFTIIVSTILNVLYFFPIIVKAFFGEQNNNKVITIDKVKSSDRIKDVTQINQVINNHKIDVNTIETNINNKVYKQSISMNLAMIITTIMVIFLNIYSFFIINFLTQ